MDAVVGEACPRCGFADSQASNFCSRCGQALAVAPGLAPTPELGHPAEQGHEQQEPTRTTLADGGDPVPVAPEGGLAASDHGGPAVNVPTVNVPAVGAPDDSESDDFGRADLALEMRAAVPYAAAAAGVAGVLWLALGPISLLLDLVVGVWLFIAATTRTWRIDAEGGAKGVLTLWSVLRPGVSDTARLREPIFVLTAGFVLFPLVVGLVAGVVFGARSALHLSDRADVCKKYAAYVERSSGFSFGFDNAWFRALDSLGTTAKDYSGPNEDMVREAGAEAVRLAAKNSVYSGEADRALQPVAALCAGGLGGE